MPDKKNLYKFKTPKSGQEEIHFFHTSGRITVNAFLKRFLLSICLYLISFIIFNFYFKANYDQLKYRINGEISIAKSYFVFEFFHYSILPLVLLFFIVVQGVKRMHDINKSGKYFLIPFYNIYLVFQKGTIGNNNFGLDPNPEVVTFYDELKKKKPQQAKGNTRPKAQKPFSINYQFFNDYFEVLALGLALMVILVFILYYEGSESKYIEKSKIQAEQLNKAREKLDSIMKKQ
jgi:uncharacterized membrane protein YhaH (DUF805 family)